MRLIDADALILPITEVLPQYLHIDDAASIIHTVDVAPTVDAVPVVHGKWLRDDKICDLYSCSGCGHKDHREPKHNYCPHCGAKMDG